MHTKKGSLAGEFRVYLIDVPTGLPAISTVDTFVGYGSDLEATTAEHGVDYHPFSGVLNIPAGQSEWFIGIPVYDDATSEDTETVGITLTSLPLATVLGQNAKISSTHSGAVIDIYDNDLPLIIPNAAPEAIDDQVIVNEDAVVNVNVTTNDTDSDGFVVPTSVAITSQLEHGSVTVDSSTGQIRIEPDPNFHGDDHFKYTIRDNEGAISNEATVALAVRDINDAPQSVDSTATTDEDVPVSIDLTTYVSDVDGQVDPTTLEILATNNATVVHEGNGVVTYTPNLDFSGTDSFTYTVQDDDQKVCRVTTVTVTVNQVNDAPQAVEDLFEVDGFDLVTRSVNEHHVAGVVLDVLANDGDVDDLQSGLTVTIVTAPQSGTATVDEDGSVFYLPGGDFLFTDNFEYLISDESGASSGTAAVAIQLRDASESNADSVSRTTENAIWDEALLGLTNEAEDFEQIDLLGDLANSY